jgi:hypothetical protein
MLGHPLGFLRIQSSRLASDNDQENLVLISLSESQAVPVLCRGCALRAEPDKSAAQEQSENQDSLFHGSNPPSFPCNVSGTEKASRSVRATNKSNIRDILMIDRFTRQSLGNPQGTDCIAQFCRALVCFVRNGALQVALHQFQRCQRHSVANLLQPVA